MEYSLAPAGTGKTVIIYLLKSWYCTVYRDNFTPAAFVTNTTNVNSEEELLDKDLLPQIKNKLFLTPELQTMFSGKEEVLTQLLGILTRIADGQGYVVHTGAHGRRGYEDAMMFTWVGAAVEIPHKVHKLLGNMGAKMYFFRMNYEEKDEGELALSLDEDFNRMRDDIRKVLFDYLKWFECCPTMDRPAASSPLPKVRWDKTQDEKEAKLIISRCAILLAHLRCNVRRWWDVVPSSTYDYLDPSPTNSAAAAGSENIATIGTNINTNSKHYYYSASKPEDPTRATTILYNLARAHALNLGRNYIKKDDLSVAIKTTLSTAPIDRVSIFSLLLACKGTLLASNIIKSLNVSKSTADRAMTELEAIGLIDREMIKLDDNNSNTQLNNRYVTRIKLKHKFNWFLSEEFDKLKDGFVAQDYRSYISSSVTGREEDKEELSASSSSEPSILPSVISDNEKIALFWQIYNELESVQAANQDNHTDIDRQTVSGQQLRNGLVSSGKFFAGEAVEILDHMIKVTKQLEQVSFDTYRRIK